MGDIPIENAFCGRDWNNAVGSAVDCKLLPSGIGNCGETVFNCGSNTSALDIWLIPSTVDCLLVIIIPRGKIMPFVGEGRGQVIPIPSVFEESTPCEPLYYVS